MSIVYKALQQAEMENPGIDAIKGDEPFAPNSSNRRRMKTCGWSTPR